LFLKTFCNGLISLFHFLELSLGGGGGMRSQIRKISWSVREMCAAYLMADQRNRERKAGKTKMTDSCSCWFILISYSLNPLRTNKIQCDLTFLSIGPRYQTDHCYVDGSQASPARPGGKTCNNSTVGMIMIAVKYSSAVLSSASFYTTIFSRTDRASYSPPR
jgi:hypothetical protein